MPEKLLVSASVANAAIEKNVWEMQHVVRSLDAYIEWVYSTTSDPDGAILAWTAEIVGRVVDRSQSGRSEEWTAFVSAESEETAAKRWSNVLSG